MISAASRRKGTLFTISVPQVTPERLALAFKFLRGFSDGALLQANDVERQKGVVAAEMSGGKNQRARADRTVRQQPYSELPYLWQQPADRLASVHGVTAEQLRGFHDRWYRPDTAFLVIVGDIDPAATVKAIETAFASWTRAACTAAYSAPLGARDLKLAVAKQLSLPGPPGKIVDSRHIDDLDVQPVRFANGVKLTVNYTDVRAGEALAAVELDGGLLALPRGQRPVAPLLAILVFGGAGGLTGEEIIAGLRGSQFSAAGGSVNTGAVRFVSQTNPLALDEQLRVWALLIGVPSFDPRADGFVRAAAQAGLEQNDNTPLAAFQRRWPQFSHSGDPRFAALEPADVPQLEMAAARRVWGAVAQGCADRGHRCRRCRGRQGHCRCRPDAWGVT